MLADTLLSLQPTAGNAAIARLLERQSTRRDGKHPLPVQRQPAPAPTLDSAGTKATELPSAGLTAMNAADMAKLGVAGRQEWYAKSLAKFHAQICESGARHGVPPLLLAAILLNEMADISWKDVAQMGFNLNSGSLGIGQIQVTTAMATGVLPTKDRAEAARLLRIPQWNIEATAAEVARIVKDMGAHTDKPWQRNFSYTGGDPRAIFSAVAHHKLSAHSAAVAMVAAAYNSPGIVRTTKGRLDELAPAASSTWEQLKAVFPNAVNHGTNAHQIADEMVAAGIFAFSQ